MIRRISCDTVVIGFYFMLHGELFKRDRSLILNMDETMLSGKKRFKVLSQKGLLPLIPETIKLPHFIGCITFSASRRVFDPFIVLQNKKTLRSLEKFNGLLYFTGTMAGWMTLNTFTYYTILLVCQISIYRLTLPDKLSEESILLLVDCHHCRFNFLAAYILHLFDIHLVLIPAHTSHILQAFDVVLASPLKVYFKEFLAAEKFDDYKAHENVNFKQTVEELRRSMLQSFINALWKCATLNNIENAFKKTGIYPFDTQKPLNSQFSHRTPIFDPDNVLKNYWLNSPEGLKYLFRKEHGPEITEADYNINLHKIVNLVLGV